VRVLISPGTLPGSAAQALRQIASWIERDRRLLSARHWRSTGRRPDPLEDMRHPVPTAESQDDSADQA
jgi:hypothetical protein